jgi:hypothetical protein
MRNREHGPGNRALIDELYNKAARAGGFAENRARLPATLVNNTLVAPFNAPFVVALLQPQKSGIFWGSAQAYVVGKSGAASVNFIAQSLIGTAPFAVTGGTLEPGGVYAATTSGTPLTAGGGGTVTTNLEGLAVADVLAGNFDATCGWSGLLATVPAGGYLAFAGLISGLGPSNVQLVYISMSIYEQN